MKYLILYGVLGLVMGFLWLWIPVLEKDQTAILNQGLPKRSRQHPDEGSSRTHWVHKLVWGIYFVGGAILVILLLVKIIPV